MELQIISPSADGFLKAIEWNHEEIKAEVAEKVEYYKTLVYTDDQVKDAKADRAKLNAFVKALEDKRKEVKKKCLEPYEKFEKEMKEIISIVNEPIALIDTQIKGYEDEKKKKKYDDILNAWKEIDAPEGITLEKIYNPKWLNASVSLKKAVEEMTEKVEEIRSNLATLEKLPAFGFESKTVYLETLDMNRALSEGQRLAEIQRQKEEYLKAQEEAKAKAEAEAQAQKEAEKPVEPTPVENKPETDPPKAMRRKRVVLEIVASEENFDAINEFYTLLLEKAESCKILKKEDL